MSPIPDSGRKPLTLNGYAISRGLTRPAVKKAVDSGRLRHSVRDGKIWDPDLADREWAANTDYTDAPHELARRENEPPEIRQGMSLNEANTAEKFWKAQQAELKFRKDAGELVLAADMRHEIENAFATARTKLLGVPSRIRQQLPHLTTEDVALIKTFIREALEGLATAGAE